MEALLAAGASPGAGFTLLPFTVLTPLIVAGKEEIKRALRAAGAGWPSFFLETLRGIVLLGIVLVVTWFPIVLILPSILENLGDEIQLIVEILWALVLQWAIVIMLLVWGLGIENGIIMGHRARHAIWFGAFCSFFHAMATKMK